MIERVAQAMFASLQGHVHDGSDPWDSRIRETQENYRRMARAAIEAMRDPTDSMLHPLGDALAYFDLHRNDDALGIWQAMIDAALDDGHNK